MDFKRIFKRILNISNSIINYCILNSNKVNYKKTLRINGIIFIHGHGIIKMGENVKINSSLKSNPIGGDTKTIIRTINNGSINIGDNTGISNSTIVAGNKVSIGNNVLIGGSCCIYDTDFHSLKYDERLYAEDNGIVTKSIIIGDGVFIGAHSIILKGVKIGENSIVGAGSVVTKDISSEEIWAGNPAKFIRKVDGNTKDEKKSNN